MSNDVMGRMAHGWMGCDVLFADAGDTALDVLMMTGSPHRITPLVDELAQGLLIKPFSTDQLLEAVAAALPGDPRVQPLRAALAEWPARRVRRRP